MLFGAWVGFMELIPYLGPWLGAIPPVTYALIVDPVSAIWVTLLFLAIHQIEGHIVVPNVMGSALRSTRCSPIFGLLAGGEIYGLAGIFVALPLLAVLRALWEFAGERLELENWRGEGPVPWRWRSSPLCRRRRCRHGLTLAREHVSAHATSPAAAPGRCARSFARRGSTWTRSSTRSSSGRLRSRTRRCRRWAVSRSTTSSRRRRALRSRRARRDPVRDPGREGRAGLRRLGRRGRRPAGASALRASAPGLVLVTDVCLWSTPRTGTAASSRARRSRTTRPSSCWPARRSATSMPAPTPSRPAT